MKNSVIITKENSGYDISVYNEVDEKIRTAWKCTAQEALRLGNELADYYRDENGQRLFLDHPFTDCEYITVQPA